MEKLSGNFKKLFLPCLRQEKILYPPCLFLPRHQSEPMLALICLAQEFFSIQTLTRSAMLARIRLTWWQEQIQALWNEKPIDHPLLIWITEVWAPQQQSFKALSLTWLDSLNNEAAQFEPQSQITFDFIDFYTSFFKISQRLAPYQTLNQESLKKLATRYRDISLKTLSFDANHITMPPASIKVSMQEDPLTFEKIPYLHSVDYLLSAYSANLVRNDTWRPLPMTPYYYLLKRLLFRA